MKRAYLDHAAATPVRPEVLASMLPFLTERFGNPSAVYDLGSEIKAVMEEQRDKVARLIGARNGEIIFTSSGAEANNLTIKGMSLANFHKRGRHLIVSAIEHHSVLNSARFLEKWFDFEVTFLPVDHYGRVDPERLQQALTPATVMVSIGHGSNEIGTVQDIPDLVAVCRAAGVAFHTDAVATVGQVPVDVKELGVDLLTISGPVLGAIGIRPEVAQGSLVFTLNRDNREEEVHHVLLHRPPAVENLRSFSPVGRQKMAEAAGAPR